MIGQVWLFFKRSFSRIRIEAKAAAQQHTTTRHNTQQHATMSSSSEEKVSDKSSSESEEDEMLNEEDIDGDGGFMHRMKKSYFFRRIANKTNIGLFFSMQVIGILMMVYAMLYYGRIHIFPAEHYLFPPQL